MCLLKLIFFILTISLFFLLLYLISLHWFIKCCSVEPTTTELREKEKKRLLRGIRARQIKKKISYLLLMLSFKNILKGKNDLKIY